MPATSAAATNPKSFIFLLQRSNLKITVAFVKRMKFKVFEKMIVQVLIEST